MNTPSPADIRHANALTCVHVLRTSQGTLSISDVAQRTGLSRPTVDAVIAGLESHGLLSAAPADASTANGGRPARRFQFEAEHAIVAGVDAGPRNIRVVLADLQGRVVARAHREIGADSRKGTGQHGTGAPGTGKHDTGELSAMQRVEEVIATMHDALETAGIPPAKLQVACVGVSGIVGFDGRISQSFVVPEWNGIDIAKRIGQAFDCHVFLENDIKLAAFAEHHLGAAQLVSNTLYFQIGNRISLSLTLDGNIHHGFHRSSGEVGSLRGMRWTSSAVNGQLTWRSAPTAELVFAKALAGEPEAGAEMTTFVSEIASHIASVSLALDPDLIIVGGGLSRSGEPFVDLLRTEVHRLIMIEGKPNMVASTLGSDGTLLGALALAFQDCSTELFGLEGVPVPEIVHGDANGEAE
ncbi:ROK family transcriptional regulator [Glaciibacter superstes]|uniref:ROK family transcriptional regulator n=1 Tax=Glaciibacter superstes TaxID=501023 RepID=UPI0004276C2E|nr:ROK family transcriptional regulator [Glaciibacter superstes]